jgi:hypothetical protein
MEVLAVDTVMDTHLGTSKAAEPALCFVRAGALLALELARMV